MRSLSSLLILVLGAFLVVSMVALGAPEAQSAGEGVCGEEAPGLDRPGRLLAFATASQARSSTLWSFDVGTPIDAGPAGHRRLLSVEHPPGESPRGNIVPGRGEIAWVQIPSSGRRGSPGHLWTRDVGGGDPQLRDASVLSLQHPVSWGRCIAYLGARTHAPESPRFAPVELRIIDGEGEVRVLRRDRALWWQLVAAVPPPSGAGSWGIVALRMDDDGASLLELRSDGSIRGEVGLPSARILNVQPVPGAARSVAFLQWHTDERAELVQVDLDTGAVQVLASGLSRYESPLLRGPGVEPLGLRGELSTWNIEVPERVLGAGKTLWRIHENGILRWVVEEEGAEGWRQRRLLPQEDAAQDLSPVGLLP